MAWQIEYAESAAKELRKLDREAARRIVTFLETRVAARSDPRSLGQVLRGHELGEYWKFRIGDYRVIADIQDQKICILVLRVGHRKHVYE